MPQLALRAPQSPANRVVRAKSSDRVRASQRRQLEDGRITDGTLEASAQVVFQMIEAAVRVGGDDVIGKAPANQDAGRDGRPRRVFGGEVVVHKLKAGFDRV